ncbi:MAG: class I SAM-dependent methyltransferase, partial [Verrucomicrobiales bacterium]|nr:class I SAM-dependent methyltransferase [Verrucomicrobiales bacterium]
MDRAIADREWHINERQHKGRDDYLAPLLEPLMLRDGINFVDVGCGGGYINSYVSGRHRIRLNLGLDMFPDTVRLARESNPADAGIVWVCASAEGIPLETASVDSLVCRG